MNLNDYLLNTDGTQKTAEQLLDCADDTSVEVFAKVANEAGVDLSTLSREEFNDHYVTVMSKLAAECAPKDEEEGDEKAEKKAAIAAELAQSSKVAEAQELGMQIGVTVRDVVLQGLQEFFAKTAQQNEEPSVEEKVAGAKEWVTDKFNKAKGVFRKAEEAAPKSAPKSAPAAGFPESKYTPSKQSLTSRVSNFAGEHKKKLIGGGAGVAVAGGGGAAYNHYRKGKKDGAAEAPKTASDLSSVFSALDDEALTVALVKAAEQGYEPQYIAERIHEFQRAGHFNEVATKVASSMTPEQAVDVRALEILETIGFDVTWSNG
jgi:hypothetical protein